MAALPSFDYAVLRVVPSAEREEFVNAGVVLQCNERDYLQCRVLLDEARVLALWPALDLDPIRQHLQAFPRNCAADPHAGPIARLSRRERFQWLVSPRSTIIQVGPVHSGVSESPEATLDELFQRVVALRR